MLSKGFTKTLTPQEALGQNFAQGHTNGTFSPNPLSPISVSRRLGGKNPKKAPRASMRLDLRFCEVVRGPNSKFVIKCGINLFHNRAHSEDEVNG